MSPLSSQGGGRLAPAPFPSCRSCGHPSAALVRARDGVLVQTCEGCADPVCSSCVVPCAEGVDETVCVLCARRRELGRRWFEVVFRGALRRCLNAVRSRALGDGGHG